MAKKLHVPREGHYNPDAKRDDFKWLFDEYPEMRDKVYFKYYAKPQKRIGR